MGLISNEELKLALEHTENELKKASAKKEALEKAIWDMVNYANIFILLLDSKMNVLLINHSFAKILGFADPKEVIDRCWLDFIKPEEKEHIYAIHHSLAYDSEKESSKYREVINDIIKPDGQIFTIKWFNFPINHQYNLTFSFGIPSEITEETIRTYYQEILQKDKTMILSLKDMVLKDLVSLDACETKLSTLGGDF